MFAPSGWNSDPFLPPPVLAGGSGGVGCFFVKLVVVSKMVAQNKQQLLVNQPWHQAKKNTCYKFGLTFFSTEPGDPQNERPDLSPYDSPSP